MSIYHMCVKNVGRSAGRSAVASSAYRSGEKMIDEETGVIHDYTKKSGIEYTEIILCKNAPDEYKNRSTLWNAVHKVEKAKNARLCREWEVAIPEELTKEQRKNLVHDFAQSLADEGMCVDVAIHDKGDGNPHAHILATTRAIKENGEWAAKSKKVYDVDENGDRIFQKIDKTGKRIYKNHKEDYTDWNKTEKVEEWRERWASKCNQYLSQEKQVDHRSYKRQGKEQIPTIHEGYTARRMEKNGKISERCERNREIRKANEEIKKYRVIQHKGNILFENARNAAMADIEKEKQERERQQRKEREEKEKPIFNYQKINSIAYEWRTGKVKIEDNQSEIERLKRQKDKDMTEEDKQSYKWFVKHDEPLKRILKPIAENKADWRKHEIASLRAEINTLNKRLEHIDELYQNSVEYCIKHGKDPDKIGGFVGLRMAMESIEKNKNKNIRSLEERIERGEERAKKEPAKEHLLHPERKNRPPER